MPEPPCVHIPRLTDPPSLTLPGGVSIEHLRLLDIVQPALTPLMPVFDNRRRLSWRPTTVSRPYRPPSDHRQTRRPCAASIPELGAKVAKLLQLIPQLSLPMTIVGIIDLVIGELQRARAEFVHLQSQLTQLTSAVERAAELEDAELEAITNCAQGRTSPARRPTSASSSRRWASSWAFLALFMGMIGGPDIPDMSSLDGQQLDQVIAPLDALVRTTPDRTSGCALAIGESC